MLFNTFILILIFISIQITCKCFLLKWNRSIQYSRTRLNYNLYNDNDNNNKNGIPTNTKPDISTNSISNDIFDFDDTKYDILYTLIWYKCLECDKLLADLSDAQIKILYIDGSYYFFDEDDLTNHPILYKNEQLVATDLFDIYAELFS